MGEPSTRSSNSLVAVIKIEIADHFDVEEDKYICKICQWDCDGRTKALQHFEKMHDALLGKRTETSLAWRSLFSAAGECSLCDYKYTPRMKNKANPREGVCHILRMHLEARHPGKREEIVAAAFDHAIKVASDVAQMYSAGTSNRQLSAAPKDGYPCEDCGQSFPSPKECLKHRNIAHPLHSNSFQCARCGEVLDSFHALKTHTLRRHKYRCQNCELCFERRADGISHMLHCTKPQRPRSLEQLFQCSLCDKSFNVERLLKAHLAMKHNPSQQGASTTHQIGIVKKEIEDGRKRLKLAGPMPVQLASSEFNAQSDDLAQSRGCVEPKQEVSETTSDLHDIISFAIVKEEFDDFVDS